MSIPILLGTLGLMLPIWLCGWAIEYKWDEQKEKYVAHWHWENWG